MPSSNKWVLGARPRTLPAVIAPVLVGNALGIFQSKTHHINLLNIFLTLIVGLSMQIGVNYANDYSDGIKGTDSDRVGPTRLVASGLATAEAVRNAAFLCFAIGSVAGVSFALRSNPLFLFIGVLAIWAAWGYTGGKNPYGYRGFGELSVFVFFGLVATLGSFYGQYKALTPASWLTAIMMGALGCAILIVNNLRDIDGDSLVGKRTLAVRLGDPQTRTFLICAMSLPFIISLALIWTSPWFMLSWLTAPLYFSIVKQIRSGMKGRALIALLGALGKMQLGFALTTVVATIVARFIH